MHHHPVKKPRSLEAVNQYVSLLPTDLAEFIGSPLREVTIAGVLECKPPQDVQDADGMYLTDVEQFRQPSQFRVMT